MGENVSDLSSESTRELFGENMRGLSSGYMRELSGEDMRGLSSGENMRGLSSGYMRELSGESMSELYECKVQDEEDTSDISMVFERQDFARKGSSECTGEPSLNVDSGFWDREALYEIIVTDASYKVPHEVSEDLNVGSNFGTNHCCQIDDCKDKLLDMNMVVLNTLV